MRPLWFLAGAGAGVYAVVRARRAAEALTPEGWHDRSAGLRAGWQLFSEEVRAGMAEKETELRARLELGPHGDRPALTAGPDQQHHDVKDDAREGHGPDGQQ